MVVVTRDQADIAMQRLRDGAIYGWRNHAYGEINIVFVAPDEFQVERIDWSFDESEPSTQVESFSTESFYDYLAPIDYESFDDGLR